MIMEAFFIYILKVAVLTAAFGILYHYLLKKETFHRFNRMVLAASLLLASHSCGRREVRSLQ